MHKEQLLVLLLHLFELFFNFLLLVAVQQHLSVNIFFIRPLLVEQSVLVLLWSQVNGEGRFFDFVADPQNAPLQILNFVLRNHQLIQKMLQLFADAVFLSSNVVVLLRYLIFNL